MKKDLIKYKLTCGGIVFVKAKMAHIKYLKKNIYTSYIRGAVPKGLKTDHECDFGKLYFSKELQELYGSDSDFRAIEKPHKEVHALSHHIADMIQRGDHENAYTDIEKMREKVIHLIEILDKMFDKARCST